MNTKIFHKNLPFTPWASKNLNRLPGTQFFDNNNIFDVDEVYSEQLKYKEILSKKNEVMLTNDINKDLKNEIKTFLFENLKKHKNFFVKNKLIQRPDGKKIKILQNLNFEDFLYLVQEDLLVLEKLNNQYILKGGILCFPAAWSLTEKLNKNLFEIHSPVKEYSDFLSSQVDRLFLRLTPYRTIWRANWLLFDDHELYQPVKENKKNVRDRIRNSKYIRVEKQTISKFMKNDGILFTIHTYLMPIKNLKDHQFSELKKQIKIKFDIDIKNW